jgi:ubiquinone/menaquinone biosynthesis C-methylase UbiE
LDKKIVCKSYNIPLADNSVDIVFCYESAHHFAEHKKTLLEAFRVLKKGGCVLYLHEPSCRRYLYRLAHWRVNKKRPAVLEDVLVYADMISFAKECGFSETNYYFDPTTLNREPIEMIYYYFLQKIRFLKYLLPCTVDYVFKK